MPDRIVTRFAPSPTGYLHIGGARTALFNWLYARHTGGTMRLRIEDTDRARSTEAAIAAIRDGLIWLGLDWDGDAVSQFSRATRHREVVEQLLASGHAYRCYCTPQELDEMRSKASAEGRPPRYDGRWRDRAAGDAPAGLAPAIRFRAPDDGETVVDDKVQGRVVIPNKDLDDLIILRSDGNPTYNLSVVVDDHDMDVSHIIRGVDHLTNAARQTQIYLAMGWSVPVMAHIPLIHGPDGAKLSKRHGALGVEAYRDMGYLPGAMRNYLVRLGWSHGDDEIMSDEQMTAWFDFDGIGKSAARFDFAKLENLNGHYIRSSSDADLVDAMAALLPHLQQPIGLPDRLPAGERTALLAAMPGLKERAKTVVELWDGARFLFARRPLPLDEKAAGLLAGEARPLLADIHAVLSASDDWDVPTLETAVKSFAETRGLKLGKVAQPLRAALTGRSTSPGIFDVLTVLGRRESLDRIADHME